MAEGRSREAKRAASKLLMVVGSCNEMEGQPQCARNNSHLEPRALRVVIQCQRIIFMTLGTLRWPALAAPTMAG